MSGTLEFFEYTVFFFEVFPRRDVFSSSDLKRMRVVEIK